MFDHHRCAFYMFGCRDSPSILPGKTDRADKPAIGAIWVTMKKGSQLFRKYFTYLLRTVARTVKK